MDYIIYAYSSLNPALNSFNITNMDGVITYQSNFTIVNQHLEITVNNNAGMLNLTMINNVK
jgi:hypothetical protein